MGNLDWRLPSEGWEMPTCCHSPIRRYPHARNILRRPKMGFINSAGATVCATIVIRQPAWSYGNRDLNRCVQSSQADPSAAAKSRRDFCILIQFQSLLNNLIEWPTSVMLTRESFVCRLRAGKALIR